MPLALLALAAVAHPILDILISPDDAWLAVTNGTDNVWIYAVKDGKLLRTLHHKAGSHLVDLEISPDGKRMVCTNRNFEGDVSPIWDTQTWKEYGRIAAWISKGFADPANGVEYAGKGRFIVGQKLYGGEVVCWNAETGAIAYELRKIVQGGWYALAVNPNSTLVAINNPAEPRLRFWDFERSKDGPQWGTSITLMNPKLQMMRFSRKGDRLFLGFLRGKDGFDLSVYAPSKGKAEVGPTARIVHFQPRDIDWSFDDRAVYLGGLRGQIGVWDAQKGRLLAHWTGHQGEAVKALSSGNRSPLLVTGGGDTVCIWNPESGKLLRTIHLPAS